jgi:hypothetical protein
MGYEYKIRFAVPPDLTAENMVRQLPDPNTRGSEWPEYAVKLDMDGYYFLDNGRSDVAAIAFKRLVDEALRHSDQVVVEEL